MFHTYRISLLQCYLGGNCRGHVEDLSKADRVGHVRLHSTESRRDVAREEIRVGVGLDRHLGGHRGPCSAAGVVCISASGSVKTGYSS